jgi:hypothetical protein
MKTTNGMEETIKKNLNFAASTEMRERILTDVLDAQEEAKKTKSASAGPNIRSIIMKNPIIKLAAAVIIIAVALSITFLDKSIAPAYAIEQTTKALQKISTVHAFCIDWDGNKVEVWGDINAETGKENAVFCDSQSGFAIISTPEITYYYDKRENVVRLDKGLAPASYVRFGRIIEDIIDRIIKPNNGDVQINREYDQQREAEVIVLHGVTQREEFEVHIDPESKLPISINTIRSDYPSKGLKSVDRIYYDQLLPDGIFKFEIPEGVEVVIHRAQPNNVLDDPDVGMIIETETNEEACKIIIEEYWHAVINQNWSKAKKLRPMPEKSWDYLKTIDYVDNKPARLIKIKEPYQEKDCWIGPIASYVIKTTDGKLKTGDMIIKIRETDAQKSYVIAGTWGREFNALE